MLSRPPARLRARLAGTAVLGPVATRGPLSACNGGNATTDHTPAADTKGAAS